MTGKCVMNEAWVSESIRSKQFRPEWENDYGVRIAKDQPLSGIRLCLTPGFLAEFPTNAARKELKDIFEKYSGASLLAPRYAVLSKDTIVIKSDLSSGSESSPVSEKVLTWKRFLNKLVLLGKTWASSP